MNLWRDIDPKRVKPEKFLAVVEISKGSKMKYELDKETGRLMLDRVLYTSTHYPANYGFLPLTLARDGDPLDVLVLCQEPVTPLCLIECRPIGVIIMDDNAKRDEKIIAVALGDPSLNGFTDISELPAHTFDEISHFFKVYKELEGAETYVKETRGREAAEATIEKCLAAYREKYLKKMLTC